ncbi:hypothetical protein [uncultured Cytophaga sp.]|uniref:hypothetical protein n=1 Tax=uncultured Cytophaga sp. TaxID=160238 RepID=UPI00260D3278|nr:hypothetical protein [uncultured Cytophaga sp.]
MRTFIFIALLILAPVLASFYGFIHDQMTFSISEEFFTKFRFNNYEFPHSWHPRVRAGMIGMLNAWQTGIPFGIVLTAVGRIHRNTRKLLFYTFYTFVLTFTMASLFSIIAAYMPIPTDIAIARQSMPEDILDPIAFQRVVQINNFGYVGGIIGMLLGIGLHVLLYRRDKNKAIEKSTNI